ncbi:MAG: hypothetical protein PHY47_01180 [Lachnospiraceae bacterium]|nr:hypothetical protein [Lachnospiraceae bacterium]
MNTVELLEWGYYTLKDKLTFGLPEEIAYKQRETRVQAVLKDAIEQVKEMEQEIQILKEELNDARRTAQVS